ncbi:MAG: uroporphyrinogen-III decarboxylase-like protein [Candidatus Omnitrophica bacterium]|nr:uroporphyrinogen-III decarboxylase-like protein [Candidatus Omnitrophota bacterium]
MGQGVTKREVVREVLEGRRPPYVPWSFSFTQEAREKLQVHWQTEEIEPYLNNHLLNLGNEIGFFEKVGKNLYRDVFGVVWDRSVDRDIGIVCQTVLPEPNLKGYCWPNPIDEKFFRDIPVKIATNPTCFRVFCLGFSLYERAWTMRGLEKLMLDFYDHPVFVRQLLNSIAEYNIAQIKHACRFEIDAVYFGDDWGQQRGLQMGPRLWKEFIYPVLKRMYAAVHGEGKYVFIHSCGDVDELFDDLVDIGVNCFNPFQPEVMEVKTLLKKYRGRLTFFGGLSTQNLLPYGTPDQVRQATRELLVLGQAGSYIFGPAHAVEGDVPVNNILAFIEAVQSQIK